MTMTNSKLLTSSALAAGLLGAAVAAQAANVDWVGGGADDEFTTAANWSPAQVPGTVASDNARLIDSGDDAVHTNSYDSANNFNILMRNGASLAISANLKTVGTWNLGTTGVTDVGVTQTAGTVVGRTLNLGAANANTFDATYSISGGTARFTTAVNVAQNGVFDIAGDSANLAGSGAFSITDGGELSYTLAADGVSAIGVTSFDIGSGALLSIDASSYTEGEGTITLANFTSNTGTFDLGNIAITGLEAGLSGSISYTGTTMDLAIIPEPGSYAMLGGLLALGYIVVRRRS